MPQHPERPLLEIKNLRMYFPIGKSLPGRSRKIVRAVDGVELSIRRGQTLCLVGESGCGKTTIGRIIARLLEPTSGVVMLDGEEIGRLRGRALRRYRPNVQMVFQDPFTSLNPRLSVEDIIAEPLRINRRGSKKEIRARTHELLEAVGLSIADAARMPRAFSGGQRQRIAIARALALNPKLVICDEPVSALDVSIQAKILNLLVDLQERFGLTYLFISHDLSVVRLIGDQIAVMYMGKIVESGSTESVFSAPKHPYTQALMAAIPDPYVRRGVSVLGGEVPGNVDPPSGCRFHTRCPAKFDICDQQEPVLQPLGSGQQVACFLYHEASAPAGAQAS